MRRSPSSGRKPIATPLPIGATVIRIRNATIRIDSSIRNWSRNSRATGATRTAAAISGAAKIIHVCLSLNREMINPIAAIERDNTSDVTQKPKWEYSRLVFVENE